MKQFGLAFLNSLVLVGIIVGIPLYVIVTGYQAEYDTIEAGNAATSKENAQTLQQYQATADKFQTAISEQVARVRHDRALWDSTIQHYDPTVSMSDQQIHDLTYHFTLPSVSPEDAASENEIAYKLFSDQALCIDTISQFNRFAHSVPKQITVGRHDSGECNG